MEEFLKHALFGMSGLLGIVCAVLVVTRKNPIYSALFLIVLFGTIAVDFFMLQAEFLGFMQLLVYAGAIMVLYLFVIMLINLRSDELEGLKINPVMVLAAGTFLGLFSKAVADLGPAVSSESNALVGSPGLLAETLFTEYVVPFEAVSLLLLAAILGTVVLSRRSGDG